jgi:hypothetical protein
MTYYKVHACTRNMYSHDIKLTSTTELHPSFRWLPRYFPADQVSAGPVDIRLLKVYLVQPRFDDGLPEARSSIIILIPAS